MRQPAVIFDCDGVLVDSELVSCTASAEALQAYGVKTDLAEIQRLMMGKSNQEMISFFAQREDIKLDLDEVNAAIEARYYELAADLKPMPGIVPLLEELRSGGVIIAVASSGGYHKIEFSLTKTGLIKYFQMICSAIDVLRGKPAPDLFLYTAAKLGKQPEDCIVVEDSLYGVQAGKRAGIFTVGLASSFSKAELLKAGADLVIPDFSSFKKLIGLD